MKLHLIFIFSVLLILFIPLVQADRPYYDFCACVFDDLPSYPDDLEEIADLFAQNNIESSHLTPQYYLQPEFYPNWFKLCNTYYSKNKTHYGIYGFHIYPSLYDVFAKKGDIITITAFLTNNFGISVKTGVSLNITYDESILEVEQITPKNSYLLLNETYPKFNKDWVQKLTLRVTILKNSNTSIEIYNEKPPDYKHNFWKELYNTKYATAEKFITEVSQLTINIHTAQQKNLEETQKNQKSALYEYVLIIIVFTIIVIIFLIVALRKIRCV